MGAEVFGLILNPAVQVLIPSGPMKTTEVVEWPAEPAESPLAIIRCVGLAGC